MTSLHQERTDWGLSFYDIQHQLSNQCSKLKLGFFGEPTTTFTHSQIKMLHKDVVGRTMNTLREWRAVSKPFRSQTSLWTNAQVHADSDAQQASELVNTLALTLEELLVQLERSHLDINPPHSLQDIGTLITVIQSVKETLTVLPPSIFGQSPKDISELQADLSEGTGWFQRLFNPRYRRAKREIRDLLVPGANLDTSEYPNLVNSAVEQMRLWEEMGGQTPNTPDNLPALISAYELLISHVQDLEQLFCGDNLVPQSLNKLDTWIQEIRNDDTLWRIPRLANLEAELAEAGAGGLLRQVKTRRLAPGLLENAYLHAWLHGV